MASVLEEFLVSLKYQVNTASQQTFLDALKHSQTKIGVVASEIAALTVAIVKMAERFAKAGEQFFFMSQRLGSSVSDIQAATEAMTDLGASTEEARGSMENLGRFSRAYGPIATQFLAQMGITATDTEGRMRQLGARLQQMIASGPMGYPMALKWAQMFGIDENTMRAITSKEYGQRLDIAHGIQRSVYGVNTEQDRSAALDRMTQQAHQMMNLIRQFGFMFSAVMQVFSSKLFTALQPQFEHLFATLKGWLPTINTLLGVFANVVGIVMSGINALLDGLDALGGLVSHLIPGIDGLGVAFAALGTAMLLTPIGQIVAGFILLLGIFADFRAYMQGGRHLFNWEAIADFFKAVNDQIDGWSKSIGEFFGGWIDWIGKVSKEWFGFDPFKNTEWVAMMDTVRGWFHEWDDWFAKITGFHIGEGGTELLKFLKDLTGFDFSKTDQLLAFFKTWASYLDPITQAKAAWQAVVTAFGDIAALLGGEGGRTGLIDLMNRLISAMNPIAWLKNAWKDVADAIARITGSATSSDKSGDTSGGAPAERNLGDVVSDLWHSVTGGGHATPVTGSEAQLGIRDQLTGALQRHFTSGVDEEDANAIMSSWFQESSFDPHATSSSGAHGMPQWIPSRWGPLADWARQHGFDPETREGQMEMFAHDIETHPEFRQMLSAMHAEKDPAKKREIFFKVFEAGRRINDPLGSGLFTADELAKHSRWYPPTAAGPNRGVSQAPLTPPGSVTPQAPLVPGSIAGAPAMPGVGDTANFGGGMSFNTTNNFHVYASTDPHATGKGIADHQERVAMNTVRLAKSNLV